MSFTAVVAASVVAMACATSAAHSSSFDATPPTAARQSAAPRPPMTWLVFVDDLHLDFRNTGRLRDLLRIVTGELIQEGDAYAIRSSGPSSLMVDVTRDSTRLAAAIKKTTGHALSPIDIAQRKVDPAVAREVRYRAATSVAMTLDALQYVGQAAAGPTALIFISNGHDVDPAPSNDVLAVTRLARRAGVTIFAIDPRGLVAGRDLDAMLDPERWRAHIAATRDHLRMLSEPTGGFLVFAGPTLPEALKRIAGVRRN